MSLTLTVQPKRLMLFADGENLVCRYQSLLELGRKPWAETVHVSDTFVWSHRFMPRGNHIALRAIYYASVVGDDAKVRDTANAIRSLQVFPSHVSHWVHENTLYPKVFRRGKGRDGAKGIDVQLAVDVLSNVYQDNCDSVVLMGGDGDYAPILDECIRRGKVTIVAAFSTGLSEGIRDRADAFYLLDDYYFEARAN